MKLTFDDAHSIFRKSFAKLRAVRFPYVAFVSFLLAFLVLSASVDADAQRRRRRRRARPRPTTATLELRCALEGAEVSVDEVSMGSTPLEAFDVEPGSHNLRVRLPGHTEYSEVLDVAAGDRRTIDVELFPLTMVVNVSTEPSEALVFVDTDFRGQTPLTLDLTEGEYELRIARNGFEEILRQLQATPGTVENLSLTLTALSAEALEIEREWFEEPLTWILVGAGAAAVAAAIVLVAVLGAPSSGQVDAFCDPMGPGCVTQVLPWQL